MSLGGGKQNQSTQDDRCNGITLVLAPVTHSAMCPSYKQAKVRRMASGHLSEKLMGIQSSLVETPVQHGFQPPVWITFHLEILSNQVNIISRMEARGAVIACIFSQGWDQRAKGTFYFRHVRVWVAHQKLVFLCELQALVC